jgi:hypothetical protein
MAFDYPHIGNVSIIAAFLALATACAPEGASQPATRDPHPEPGPRIQGIDGRGPENPFGFASDPRLISDFCDSHYTTQESREQCISRISRIQASLSSPLATADVGYGKWRCTLSGNQMTRRVVVTTGMHPMEVLRLIDQAAQEIGAGPKHFSKVMTECGPD